MATREDTTRIEDRLTYKERIALQAVRRASYGIHAISEILYTAKSNEGCLPDRPCAWLALTADQELGLVAAIESSGAYVSRLFEESLPVGFAEDAMPEIAEEAATVGKMMSPITIEDVDEAAANTPDMTIREFAMQFMPLASLVYGDAPGEDGKH